MLTKNIYLNIFITTHIYFNIYSHINAWFPVVLHVTKISFLVKKRLQYAAELFKSNNFSRKNFCNQVGRANHH